MNWGKFFSIIGQAAPMVLASIPGAPAAIAPYVAKGVTVAATFKNKTGQEKLQIATQEAMNGIQAANAAAAANGHGPIIDEGLSTDMIQHAVATTYDVTKLLTERGDMVGTGGLGTPVAQTPPTK